MQHSKKNNIDEQVKNAMNAIKPAYREDLWAGIEAKLPAERKPAAFFWRSIAAALLLTAGAGALYYSEMDNKKEEIIAQTNIQSTDLESGKSSDFSTLSNKTENIAENPYQGIEKNASGLDDNLNRKPGNQLNNFPVKKKRSILNKENLIGNKEVNLAERNENIENAIYAVAQKYLKPVDLTVNEVENNAENTLAGKYINYNPIQTDKKKSQPGRKSGILTHFAFWNNSAYTGEQGKLNLSFDDKITYLEGEAYSQCQNNFGAEYAIPNTRFAVGVYHQRMLKKFSLKTTSGLTASAGLLNLGDGHFRVGAGITHLSSKLFKNNLSFSDQIDAKAGFIHTSRQRDFTTVQNAYGADAGIWYNSPRLMSGFSAKNINRPQYGRLEEGERLHREYQLVAAYNIPVKELSIMPWVEVKKTALARQTGAMLFVTYKNCVTIGGGYQNVSARTQRGDVMAFASVEIKNRLRVYGSYGQNMEMQRMELQQNIIQTGLRYQIQ